MHNLLSLSTCYLCSWYLGTSLRLRIRYHLLNMFRLFHVAYFIMLLFFLLSLIFIKNSQSKCFSYLLKLFLLWNNIVNTLSRSTLSSYSLFSIMKYYRLQQMVLFSKLEIIHTQKLICWYLFQSWITRHYCLTVLDFLLIQKVSKLSFWIRFCKYSFNFRLNMAILWLKTIFLFFFIRVRLYFVFNTFLKS